MKMPIIPAIPARVSGDGGLNPTKANIAPTASPNAPDCNADNISHLFNNYRLIYLSSHARILGETSINNFGSLGP